MVKSVPSLEKKIHGSAVHCLKLMDSMYCLNTVFQHLGDCFSLQTKCSSPCLIYPGGVPCISLHLTFHSGRLSPYPSGESSYHSGPQMLKVYEQMSTVLQVRISHHHLLLVFGYNPSSFITFYFAFSHTISHRVLSSLVIL